MSFEGVGTKKDLTSKPLSNFSFGHSNFVHYGDHFKGVARGGQMGQQPHLGMSLPHLGGAEGAAAPPWHGCKDPKLTKKREKHEKKISYRYQGRS